MNERVNAVVTDLIDVIRGVMLKHSITNNEFRQAIDYLVDTAHQEFELELMLQNFFEITTAEAENAKLEGSPTNIAGPFFLEGAREIGSDGEIKTLAESDGEPIVIRGKVTDLEGNPVAGVAVDVWHSTPLGTYSGVHPDVPMDLYRVKLMTADDGHYQVSTTKPVPYQIPGDGHTGRLLAAMGRHTWRPAHVHFKVRKAGLKDHITQVYFEGEDYVDSDCCDAVIPELVHPFVMENGVKTITKDFILDPA
jgi:chlorocatechol 1,2-dioxygenase